LAFKLALLAGFLAAVAGFLEDAWAFFGAALAGVLVVLLVCFLVAAGLATALVFGFVAFA